MKKACIRTKDIRMYFAHKKALDGVSLDFAAGEIHSLLGENGAGKSTLAHILSGAVRATGGSVFINDARVVLNGTASAIKNGIVMVHQNPCLALDLSTVENAELGIRASRTSRNVEASKGGGASRNFGASCRAALGDTDDLSCNFGASKGGGASRNFGASKGDNASCNFGASCRAGATWNVEASKGGGASRNFGASCPAALGDTEVLSCNFGASKGGGASRNFDASCRAGATCNFDASKDVGASCNFDASNRAALRDTDDALRVATLPLSADVTKTASPHLFLHRARTARSLRLIAQKWDISLDVTKKVYALSQAERFYSALLCALSKKPLFLVLDEPSAVLDKNQEERFLRALTAAVAEGLGVIYITHNIEEAMRISAKITVLRRGKTVCTFDKTEAPFEMQQILKCMFEEESMLPFGEFTNAKTLNQQGGAQSSVCQKTTHDSFLNVTSLLKKVRELTEKPRSFIAQCNKHEIRKNQQTSCDDGSAKQQNSFFSDVIPAKKTASDSQTRFLHRVKPFTKVSTLPEQFETALSLRAVYAKPLQSAPLNDVTLSVPFGAITLIHGEKQSGIETLEHIVTGMCDFSYFGVVSIRGTDIKPLTPAVLRAHGVGIVPSDKYFRGSNPLLTVKELLIPYEFTETKKSVSELDAYAQNLIDSQKIDIELRERVANLSGGMLQRLILARELATRPKILILASPLHGLDRKTSANLEEQLRLVSDAGTAVLVLSSDIEESFTKWDKRYTIKNGTVSEPFYRGTK